MTATTKIDLTGMKFGKLTAIRRVQDKRGKTAWECLCECGNICHARPHLLLYSDKNRRRSCGCVARPRRGDKVFPDMPFGNKYVAAAEYIHGARQRHIEWGLNADETLALLEGNCYYCDAKPSLLVTQAMDEPFVRNGIDRLNAGQGYHTDNCVSCCTRCNYLKNDMSMEDFLNTIRAIYEHRIKNDGPGVR